MSQMSRQRLTRLDDATVSQIAAGEVISRPVRVVSELVDNALDAGAERVEIAVDGDGTERIRVADDGCGLTRAEARLAVERHTTSKLSGVDDARDGLTAVSTLGFRGEALAAIADCATLELVTNAGDTAGCRLRVDDEVTVSDAGRAQGTTVTVTDLFGDRPVRRASLSGSTAEFRRISERVSRYVLGRPSVRFSLSHDERTTLRAPGTSVREALRAVYDADTASQATTIEHAERIEHDRHSGELRIRGILAYPSVTRATRDHVRVAVDGRPVDDSGLRAAIIAGYGSLVPGDRHPVAALDVSPPAGWVDPNVHPTKNRVELRGRNSIESRVESAVREALSTADARRTATAATGLDSPLSAVDQRDPFADLRVIGAFRDLYVLCEDGDDLLVIDQHAAHERVNYERLRAAVDDSPSTAPLEPPQPISVSPTAAAAAESHRDLLAALGFAFDSFGGTTLRVSTVPAPCGRVVDPDALGDILDQLAGGESPTDPRESVLTALACRPSLKAGDRLSVADAEALLARLGECDQPFACPHGRPTVCSIDETTLAAGFDRTATRFD